MLSFILQILIRGNDTSVNNTVLPSVNEVTLYVNGMAAHKIYTIQISALNEQGQGPFSAPLEIELDPLLFSISPSVDRPLHNENIKQISWIIAIVAILSFILILLSALFVYKRKLSLHGRKPVGYLEASTDEFHHCHLARQTQTKEDDNLWIDQRWKMEEEESNSSEKKLLPNSNSNSDTEYTYVDRHNLSGLTNVSNFSRRATAESPEPYASTDIFQHHNSALTRVPRDYMQYLRPNNHYAAPSFIAVANTEVKNRQNFSCDDLRAKVSRSNKRKNRTMNNSSSRPLGNLLDILPPPPSYPPPPPNGYAASQESVISPQYLFRHPVYQSTQRSLDKRNVSNPMGMYSKVQPSEMQHLQNANNEGFTRILPSKDNAKSFNDLDKDLENELQIFNEAITKFSSNLRNRHEENDEREDSFEENCDADGEDNASAELN